MTRAAQLALAALIASVLPGVASARPISRTTWLSGVLITEYFPAPERWAIGAKVRAPGLSGRFRIDWLYGNRGMSMEGEGVALDGRRYHIDSVGRSGWVNESGRRTIPGANGWSNGRPFFRAVGWRDAAGRVTFPLAAGGWLNGRGVRYITPRDIAFAPGQSRPLRYYRSVAVDPDLIPLGSMVYIPAYKHTAGRGWFRAQDVGGAIIGRHLDVYRSPPSSPSGGNLLRNQRVKVVPPR